MVKIINDVIIVFLINYLDFDNKEKLEEEFKNILDKLEKIYHIEIKGSYRINVYKNNIYGAILEIKKDCDYCNYFNTIDMSINIIDTDFIYELDDCFVELNCDKYLYNNRIYFDINNRDDLFKIIEYSKVIYKENHIRKNGKKINNML